LIRMARSRKFLKRFLGVFTLFLILAAWKVDAVSAQKATPSDDDVNAIAKQLYCPVCENTPLDVCPTQACHDWRELIRQQLAAGKTPDQIKQYFVDHYGARVLPEPPAKGFNWLIYIVPPVAFLLGVFLLFQAFRLWKRQRKDVQVASGPVATPELDDGYVNRLEEELRKRQ
jgi:cytochrome c-type biogenesis protein CcmH